MSDFRIGFEPQHLELSLGARAADGLLAIFYLVGLELKREFVAGVLPFKCEAWTARPCERGAGRMF